MKLNHPLGWFYFLYGGDILYNTGQTAVFLKDLKGRDFPAIAEVNRKRRVNGQREISLSFLYTEINKDFMPYLEFGWKVLFKGEWYTITNPGYSTDGNYLSINVTAILSFFVDLNGYYLQNKVENKSYTPGNYFNEVFAGTPYSFVLVDAFAANTMTFEDNENKTVRFLYGIDRFYAEFKVQGKLVYIHKLVGYDKDVILHEDLNVNNVRMDVDASGFHTFAKGFGDLPESNGEEEPEYQLEVEYRSPLIAKFGEIEGPALKDGNYKSAENLTAAVKDQVENSYTVSTEVDTVDLSNNGYSEMVFEEGDRIWLFVNRLNLNQQVRVMEVDETFDWEGNKINDQYVLGNEGIATRYKTQQYDSIKDFRDIVTGRKPLQYNWLPDAVKRASEIINGNQDSLFQYRAGEIIGINQSNPNGYMRFNTDGIGFSRDGGKTYITAITYEGIVADAINVGTMRGILIEGVEIYGSMFQTSDNADDFIRIQNNQLRSHGRYSRVWNGVEESALLNLGIRNGQMWVSNEETGFNLYFTERGLSTTMAGATEGLSSGTLEFHSQRFNQTSRGVTLHSSYGTVALVSDYSSIVTRSKLTNNIESEEYSVYVRPFRNSRGGLNEFQFYVKDNPSVSDTDGALLYGNITGGATHGSGIRFSKQSSNPTVYATNINGDIGTGRFHADRFLGHLSAPGDGYLYLMADERVRITDRRGYNNGNYLLRDLQTSFIQANSIRVNDNDSNFYIGTSTGEVRITNNLLYNGGNTGYQPIKASEYRNGSSITYKTNIEDLEDVGLYNINKLTIKRYILQSDVDNGIYDNWQIGVISELSPEVATKDGLAINVYKMLSYAVKGIQELSVKSDTQQLQLAEQELLISELIIQNESQQQQLTDLAVLNETLTNRLTELENRVAQLEVA